MILLDLGTAATSGNLTQVIILILCALLALFILIISFFIKRWFTNQDNINNELFTNLKEDSQKNIDSRDKLKASVDKLNINITGISATLKYVTDTTDENKGEIKELRTQFNEHLQKNVGT